MYLYRDRCGDRIARALVSREGDRGFEPMVESRQITYKIDICCFLVVVNSLIILQLLSQITN